MKDPQLRDKPYNEKNISSIHRSLGQDDSQIHLYDKGHPDVHGVYRDFRKLLDEYSQERPRVSLGEIHIFDWEEWSSYYGKDLDEIHLPINFTLLNTAWEPEQVRQQVDALERILPEGAWPNYVLGNHDEARLASRIGIDQARIAAMPLLTLRGTPTLYNGDEIGMTNGEIPPECGLDPAGWNQPCLGQGRDICRTPMQWSPREWAGFSPQGAESTWLPIHSDYQKVNVENQLNEPDSLLQLYSKLIKFRKNHPALHRGSYRALDGGPSACYCYLRETPDQGFLICLNFTSEQQELDYSILKEACVMLSTYLDRDGRYGSPFTLRPHEGCLIKL